MESSFEYASFWIWDTENVDSTAFSRLQSLTKEGWEVVGTFLTMEQINNKTGLWMLRKKREAMTLPLAA